MGIYASATVQTPESVKPALSMSQDVIDANLRSLDAEFGPPSPEALKADEEIVAVGSMAVGEVMQDGTRAKLTAAVGVASLPDRFYANPGAPIHFDVKQELERVKKSQAAKANAIVQWYQQDNDTYAAQQMQKVAARESGLDLDDDEENDSGSI